MRTELQNANKMLWALTPLKAPLFTQQSPPLPPPNDFSAHRAGFPCCEFRLCSLRLKERFGCRRGAAFSGAASRLAWHFHYRSSDKFPAAMIVADNGTAAELCKPARRVNRAGCLPPALRLALQITMPRTPRHIATPLVCYFCCPAGAAVKFQPESERENSVVLLSWRVFSTGRWQWSTSCGNESIKRKHIKSTLLIYFDPAFTFEQ